jgi:hypothetical protein
MTTPARRRPVLYLNLLFLLSIILLPVTTGLIGTYGNARDIVVLYCCHLTALAGSNGILWLLAGLPRGQPSVAAGMAFTTTVFVLATLFALIAPQTYIAQWLWNCACDANYRRIFRKAQKKSNNLTSLNVRVGSKPEKLNASACFPLCPAGSTGRRNTGIKSLCWRFKLQGLTWPFV